MKLKNRMNSEAKQLLDDKKNSVYPEGVRAGRVYTRRRTLIAALSVALIAALIVPFVVVALNRSASEDPLPAIAQTEESAKTPEELSAPTEKTAVGSPAVVTEPTVVTEPSVVTEPTAVTEPTVDTEPTAVTEPTAPALESGLPRVPENTPLYFSVNPEYLKKNNVRLAYAPQNGEQAALEALIGGKTDYRELDRLVSRFSVNYDKDGQPVVDTVPFLFWGADEEGKWKACDLYYCFEFNAAEMDLDAEDFGGRGVLKGEPYRFSFELWYREAGSGEDFKGISTTVDTKILPYIYPPQSDDNWRPVFMRIPTYNEGIRDLHSGADGAPLDYEFVIVIRDSAVEGDNVIGWKSITVTITSDYEKLLAQGFKNGLLELPQ